MISGIFFLRECLFIMYFKRNICFELGRIEMVQNMYKSDLTLEKISEIANIPVDKLKEILQL